MPGRRWMYVLTMVSLAVLGCSGGDGAGEDGRDAAAGAGTDADPGPVVPICQQTCAGAAECAVAPTDPRYDQDNYACEQGRCRYLGCQSDTECQAAGDAWGCDRSAAVPTCVQSCDAAAECAAGAVDPRFDTDNYACDDGLCRYLGCQSDSECEVIGADWTCQPGPVPTCVQRCGAPIDCAYAFDDPRFDADNFACEDDLCVYLGCQSDSECATAGAAYVCE